MTGDESGTGIEFEPGIRRVHVVDHIQNADLEVRTPERIDPVPVDDDAFQFPVAGGVAFEASGVSIPQYVSLYVYDLADGDLVETTTVGEEIGIGTGRYEIDLPGNPMKIYLNVRAPVTVEYEDSRTVLLFDEPTTVKLGARSLHERPAGTITTTGDPEELLEAISLFSSSLKTRSPERSYPSLRGHPPGLEIGSEFHVPEGVSTTETGVEIGVTPSPARLYTVAPLAFYLDADLVPTDGIPYLAADGARVDLDRGEGFAAGVHRTLERQLIFDCVLRTEGLYSPDLVEREVMEPYLDFDIADAYEWPLAERVGRCLELPAAAFDRPSAWHLVADVAAITENVTLLPYFVSDLAHVRSGEYTEDVSPAEATPDEIRNFLRGGTNRSAPTRAGVRQESDAATTDGSRIVTPPETDAVGHAWADEYVPIGAAKPTVEALRRRHDATVEETMLTEVTVVCNDEEMREESEALYGFRDVVSLSADVHFDLSTEELRTLLTERETDFLHYIGHVDAEGMRCPNGTLDLRTLGTTGVELFFLNACESYDQGLALLEAGARGGIVTVAEVYNVIATKFGRRVARLMDAGFDLYSALDVGQDGTLAGGSYAIVGDGRAQLCNPTDGIPALVDIETGSDDERITVHARSYPTITFDIGTNLYWHFDKENRHFVAGGKQTFEDVSVEDIRVILEENNNPVQVDGELRWSDNVSIEDLL